MKTKSFNKKLSLSKQTVAHLSESDLDRAKGGLSGYTCPNCPSQKLTCFTDCGCFTDCTSDIICSC